MKSHFVIKPKQVYPGSQRQAALYLKTYNSIEIQKSLQFLTIEIGERENNSQITASTRGSATNLSNS